jgi:hypothetical protein
MILSSLAAGSLIAGAQPPSATGIQWTDVLTAIGTVGATIAAVVGLLLNQQSAKRDRRTAAAELEAERKRSASEAEQRYLLTTLSLVTDSFAVYKAYGATDERGQIAFRKLRVYLNILPDDVATLIRHELGIAMSKMSEETLLAFAKERGWTLNAEAVRSGTVEPAARWAYEELAENSAHIVMPAPSKRSERRADRFRPQNPDL